MKRLLRYLTFTSIAVALLSGTAIAQDNPSATPAPVGAKPMKSIKNYPDYSFQNHIKEYISDMKKGGHNLLIWRDGSVDLSQYGSVRLTEFNGRLLPQQTYFPYDPYIALFNSVLKSSLRLNQKDSPDALLIEGGVVECNPGSRAARAWVGMGAGRAGCAAVCEIFVPGRAEPCIRIYTRDTSAAGGSWGGDSQMMMNNILTVIATRLATTLNTTIPVR